MYLARTILFSIVGVVVGWLVGMAITYVTLAIQKARFNRLWKKEAQKLEATEIIL